MTTTLETSEAGGVRVLRLKGSLTKEGVDQVGGSLATAGKGTSAVVVDLSGVDLLATPGITMLLTAQRVDTNSLYLTAELNNLGGEVVTKCVIGDDRERLADAIRRALSRSACRYPGASLAKSLVEFLVHFVLFVRANPS